MARAALPDLPGHSLGEVISALGADTEVRALCPSLDWHDALFDAVACLVALRRIIERGDWSAATVGQMLSPDTSAYHRRRGLQRTAHSAGWGM
jgi:DNA polymerase III epsilon subunit-like protein